MTVLRKLTRALFPENRNHWKYGSRPLMFLLNTVELFIRLTMRMSSLLALHRRMARSHPLISVMAKWVSDLLEKGQVQFRFR